jgi:polyhydroxyalkanoate synthesis regulator phasin
LDIYLVADKYEVPILRNFLESKIILFYDMLQRPQNSSKSWTDQSKEAFGRVLQKLYTLDQDTTVDTTTIRRSVVHFITCREKTVMQWPEVISAVEEYSALSNDIIKTLFASRKSLQSHVDELEQEVLDLKETVEQLEDTNNEIYGELETTRGLLTGLEDSYYGFNDDEYLAFLYEELY